MEKAIDIKERKIMLKATANSLLIYKANFERDGLTDIFFLSDPSRDPSKAVEILLCFLWTFAKTKNQELEPFDEWDIKKEEAIEAMPRISGMISSFSKASIKAKQVPAARGKSRDAVTTETLLRRAVERGLAPSDLDDMTLGMLIDYLIACQNEDIETQKKKKTGNARSATADDIAAF